MKNRVYVWDWPLRLFHWLLAMAVVAAYVSHRLDAMEWHQRFGLTIIALIVFRLAWGVVGSQHARFSDFLRGPAAVRAYLRGEWRGLGHNPLGGWFVLFMLLVPLVIAASGLFANDDVAFAGLLSGWVDKALSDRLTGLHHLGFNVLLALVGLHLAAIAFYRLKRRVDLVQPMLSGWKESTEAMPASTSARRGGVVTLLFSLLLAGLAVAGVVALEPAPPPAAPAAEVPEW